MKPEFIHRRGKEDAEFAQRRLQAIASANLCVLRSSAVKAVGCLLRVAGGNPEPWTNDMAQSA